MIGECCVCCQNCREEKLVREVVIVVEVQIEVNGTVITFRIHRFSELLVSEPLSKLIVLVSQNHASFTKLRAFLSRLLVVHH